MRSVNYVRKAFCSLFLFQGSFKSITIQLVTNNKSSMPSQPYPRKSRGRHSDPTILSLLNYRLVRICIRNYHDLDHEYHSRFTSTLITTSWHDLKSCPVNSRRKKSPFVESQPYSIIFPARVPKSLQVVPVELSRLSGTWLDCLAQWCLIMYVQPHPLCLASLPPFSPASTPTVHKLGSSLPQY